MPERERGAGRPSEYSDAEAREFAYVMSRAESLARKLAPRMDEAHVKRWKATALQIGNGLNPRMNQIRRERAALDAAAAGGDDAATE